jgi:hypothetical protein
MRAPGVVLAAVDCHDARAVSAASEGLEPTGGTALDIGTVRR